MPVRQQKPIVLLLLCCVTAVCAAGYSVLNTAPEAALQAEPHSRQEASPAAQHPTPLMPQPDDQAVIAGVEQLGGHAVLDSFGRVTKVILHRCPVTDADLPLLEGLGELRTLNLRGASCVGPGITDAGLKHLADLKNLRVLELSVNPGITGEGLKWLGNLKRVEVLNLSNTYVTNEGLVHLQGLTNLKRLSLPCPVGPGSVLRWPRPDGGGCTQEGLPALWGLPIEELSGLFFYDNGFQYLKGLNHLRRLDVDFGNPNDTELVYLKDFARLESVAVGLTEGWGNTTQLRWLGSMKGLKALDIGGKTAAPQDFDASGLSVLAKLPVLERLRLGRITDAGMAHLPELPNVRVLDLSISEIQGPGLVHLKKFPNLEALTLDPTMLTVEGFQHLPELPQLRTLCLDGTPFRGEGLSYLCPEAEHDRSLKDHLADDLLLGLERVPGLRELSLGGLPITDTGLAHLQHTPRLKVLNVWGTQITDRGLVHVRGLEQLQTFGIENTAVSWEAASVLHKVRPQCRISDNWCCGCMAFEPVRSKNTMP